MLHQVTSSDIPFLSCLVFWFFNPVLLHRLQLPSVIGNLHIQKLAGYFLVRHQYAFTLAWDGVSAVYIKMAPEYLGKTHGLCGNNNAVLQDDLETSYGEYLKSFWWCNTFFFSRVTVLCLVFNCNANGI